jgi:hypothetical protein
MQEMEQCPECHIPGKRKTLARYEDGHGYCFYCSYYEKGDFVKMMTNKEEHQGFKPIPRDASTTVIGAGMEWLRQYELTRVDVLYNDIMWSESNQLLIFPFKADEVLLAWQARDFKPDAKSKWFSQGNLRDIFHILGNHSEREIVLVEDIVSAIKVARYKNAMCLFGSSPPDDVLARVKTFYDKAYVWLDADAQDKAMKACKRLEMMGVKATPFFTTRDPKEHTYKELDYIFNGRDYD